MLHYRYAISSRICHLELMDTNYNILGCLIGNCF